MLSGKNTRRYLVLLCAAWVLLPHPLSAKTTKSMYHGAEACYKKVRSDPEKRKYRDGWLRCIEEFQDAYRNDPSDPWAPAALFMSGKLYLELHKHSYREADRDQAVDIFERVISRYPKSRYKQRAQAAMGAPPKQQRPKPAMAPPDPMRKRFAGAQTCYRGVADSEKKRRYRDNWLRCIEEFRSIHHDDPSGPWAAAGLFMSGKLYMGLHGYSYRDADKQEAIDLFETVVANYPQSRYHGRAEEELGLIAHAKPRKASTPPKVDAEKEDTDQPDKKYTPVEVGAEETPDLPGKDQTTVTGLRYWSNPNYTRIVVDTDDRKTSYTHRLLKKDPAIQKPQRLYIDISNSRLGEEIKKIVPIHDDLLEDARAGQYTPDVVRIVVDIKSFERYRIFYLLDPFRIVIDVRGGDTVAAQVEETPRKPSEKAEKLPPGALAKQLALGVSRIVIDPGHGGRDNGAPGYKKGASEKHITLSIAKRLAEKIREELGCEVILTRTTDKTLTLEERTAIANTRRADLFISIHTNALEDRRAYGIMTYILNLATDEESIRVAAMENATSTKNISDLQSILSSLMQNAKIEESTRLGAYIQKSMCGRLEKKYSRIRNRGVKQGPFYVLMGAQMPAVLIETSFISNPREYERLRDPNYQDWMAEGIVDGIRSYIREINPAAS